MFKFITNKISNKIIISLFVLMSISSLFVTYISTLQVKVDSIAETKKNLDMLNTAMFQSLRNAMNTGIPETIKKAGDDARAIDGVKRLVIARSKPHLEMYDPQGEFTKDPDVLKSFETKENQLLETNDENGHNLRMIKPMIAEQECLMCHANQKKGDIIGIMDLTFSLEESDAKINNLVVEMLVISTIFGWITIGLIFFIVKRATKPIATLKNGFEDLLNSNDPSIKLNVESKDEIGEVAQLFNSYMDKVRAGLKQDEKVIEEANDILEKTGNGFFVYQVKSNASNPYVEDLKNKLNSMIIHTKDTLDKINLTLKNYSESKFDYKIDDNGIYGDLGSLTAGIKLVGNNTSEILAMIMNTGDSLNENTHTLSTASNQLSQSSNRQAASLEETAAALEQITANIKGNTEASIEMSTLANKVTKSAQSGHELANQTTTAMDDINTQVTSINEAIDVIDQIAFQTNILSLNAAVEAATAGEAGKGFAVVAQEVRNLASRSAEAAKEIKDLVEKATHKANQGKQISDTMITGYEELNENIKSTIEKIEQVSNASKEQEAGIIQINDAVNLLDKATQENAQIAEQISTMSKNIANMSNSLVTAASRASFLQEARQEVCNVDLVYDTAKLKVHVLGLKDDVYSKLGSYEKWTTSSCSTVSAWIEDYLKVNPNCDNNAVKELEELNMSLKVKLQELVDANANKENTQILNEKAKAVEIESLRIFGTLNKLKKEACKENK